MTISKIQPLGSTMYLCLREGKKNKELACVYYLSYTSCKIHAAIMGQAGLGITEISNKKCNCLIFRELWIQNLILCEWFGLCTNVMLHQKALNPGSSKGWDTDVSVLVIHCIVKCHCLENSTAYWNLISPDSHLEGKKETFLCHKKKKWQLFEICWEAWNVFLVEVY